MKYRRLFLPEHSYYLTLVTYRRKPLLVDHIDLLREAFRKSKEHHKYHIDAIVILPDHLHMIITPDEPDSYPDIIKQIKRSFVYLLPQSVRDEAKHALSPSQYRRGHAGIWQSRYYEHTIRNEKEMMEKMQYIQTNPVKHGWCEMWEEWGHSSFVK